ncbi:potassium-transporting ATPase subunit KdpC [Paramixta manurensis]|uniref:Potassium-transporting ATPase KdpC subunit n=1 Tax=Paramixta manurensis TaxID=2740817 RepID=A0A6M8UJ97_9GAMM|nr:potassium-transporting ATPase subunit KdpC [Erwiniaceae bacterium PD-1]
MNHLRPAISLFILLSLVTGVGYPLLTTGLAQWWFPLQARGSLMDSGGQVRGSALIGQNFTRADYFQGRPSATADRPYNPLASSGSNLAVSNPAQDTAIKQRVAALRQANPRANPTVPVELVTASASGLDPQISPAAAEWQIPRIAQARHLPQAALRRLVAKNTVHPLLWFIGEPVVNVLALNMALDKLQP